MSQAAPPLFCQTLAVPKAGHRVEEYEDAAAGDVRRGRFAVADGATESSFAALWAQLLGAEFVAAPADGFAPWSDWLPPLRRRWTDQVGARALPWYAEMKLQQGAFATFLGVVVRGGRWQAVAVGDSCAFHVRAGRLERTFPVACAAEFGTTPWLIGSRGPGCEMLEGRAQRIEGDWRAGDRLWLMTDALAQWFLEQAEQHAHPWQELEGVLQAQDPGQALADWVAGQRRVRRLRNDDVTLLVVQQERS
ncbi:MAG: protein phosphatase 2C domain-containing protein [Gemmataceae bacterium]|nr:protein phosphatase 2C domain-containing protein [Gemmataceae bacterium]